VLCRGILKQALGGNGEKVRGKYYERPFIFSFPDKKQFKRLIDFF